MFSTYEKPASYYDRTRKEATSPETQEEIMDCLKMLHEAKAITVAYWRLDRGLRPTFTHAEIGLTMMDMEEKGILSFDEETGRYSIPKGES